MLKKKKRNISGMSLLEIMVVVVIFSILGVIITRAIILTLRGSKKSESLFKTRENLSFATSVIERHVRNASSITGCPFENAQSIEYVDREDVIGSFSCEDLTGDGYIASSSARITSEEIKVSQCSFSCTESQNSIVPPTVTLRVTASDKNAVGIENAQVDLTTQIQLRTY